MIILDTLPLVDYFKGTSKDVRKIISDWDNGDTYLGISAVTLSELFYLMADYRGEDFARACIDSIKAQLTVFSIDPEIAQKAGEMKFRYAGKGFPMADAMIAATTWKYNAELVTSDPHFEKVNEIKIRKL